MKMNQTRNKNIFDAINAIYSSMDGAREVFAAVCSDRGLSEKKLLEYDEDLEYFDLIEPLRRAVLDKKSFADTEEEKKLYGDIDVKIVYELGVRGVLDVFCAR